jgi:hypothetical protein
MNQKRDPKKLLVNDWISLLFHIMCFNFFQSFVKNTINHQRCQPNHIYSYYSQLVKIFNNYKKDYRTWNEIEDRLKPIENLIKLSYELKINIRNLPSLRTS